MSGAQERYVDHPSDGRLEKIVVSFLRGRDTKPQIVARPGGNRRATPTSDWIPSTCRMCLTGCGILVNVENGVVNNVIGNPDSPHNRGRMCAKGKSGIMNHYNPNRVTHPLKRTNPDKGIGVDPFFEEISWEEAIDTVSKKLKKVYDEDPRKLYLQYWGGQGQGYMTQWLSLFRPVFGTPHVQGGLSSSCGKTIHTTQYLVSGGFWQEPNFDHCNYLILCGTQMGFAARDGFNHQVPDCAAARERGMKVVVVDPIGNNAAAKANEWLPIRPGTDAAFGLGMLNVLLNEVKIYDAEFLKHRTNAGYLVAPDGKYARDSSTKKPLLYDRSDGHFKVYDDPTLTDPTLGGEYEVEGRQTKPAFGLLKARAAQYPVERVEEITSIPANTIRRIAREFGEAAQVGATINIDGVELPYRPVAIDWARGPQGHKHAWHHSWALELVILSLGAINVPGSMHAVEGATNYPRKAWPMAGHDGMMQEASTTPFSGHRGRSAHPGRPVTKPTRADLFELFPVANHTKTVVPMTFQDSDKYGIDPRPVEVVIHTPSNELMGGFGDMKQAEAWYKSMDFIAGFAIELNETHNFDDIVLPALTYLEQGSFIYGSTYPAPAVAGEAVAFRQIQQRVVEPPEGVRDTEEVLMEMWDRIGILDDVYLVMNRTMGLEQPYLLEKGQRYTPDEISDRQAKSLFGEEHGWDWFKENGVLVWKRNLEERYPGPYIKARVPVYLEHYVQRGEELEAVLTEMNLDWDISDYDAMPHWRPCVANERLQQGEIDAIGVHYKLPFVYGAYGQANPWIDELCEKLPHAYGVLINGTLARRRGIKDGDTIWLESPVRRVKAVARVTQMVHPDVVGIAAHSGHWSEGKPVSQDKGVNFNGMLVHDLDHVDMVSSALDHCAQLKVYRA